MNIYFFIMLNTIVLIASFWAICYGFRHSQELIRRKRKALRTARRMTYNVVRILQRVLSKVVLKIVDEDYQQCMDERPERPAQE